MKQIHVHLKNGETVITAICKNSVAETIAENTVVIGVWDGRTFYPASQITHVEVIDHEEN